MADYNEPLAKSVPTPLEELKESIDYLHDLVDVRSIGLIEKSKTEIDLIILINRNLQTDYIQSFIKFPCFDSPIFISKSEICIKLIQNRSLINFKFFTAQDLKSALAIFEQPLSKLKDLTYAHGMAFNICGLKILHEKKDEFSIFKTDLETKRLKLSLSIEFFMDQISSLNHKIRRNWEADNGFITLQEIGDFLNLILLSYFILSKSFMPQTTDALKIAQKEITFLPLEYTSQVHEILNCIGQLPDAGKRAQINMEKMIKQLTEIINLRSNS